MFDEEMINTRKEKEELRPVDLINSVITAGLFPKSKEINFFQYDEIIIDFDSILSLALREDLTEWTKEDRIYLSKILTNNMLYFLEQYIETSHISIYYNMEKYKAFSEIYPNWCIKRQQRYGNETIINLVHKLLIKKLEKLAEIKPSFSIIKCEDAPIMRIFKDMEHSNKSFIILSRDPHMLCLFAYYDVAIYNGRFIVNRSNYYLENEYPKVHYTLIPAYYMMAGISRNEYKGVNGLGPKKTNKLINENKLAVIKQELPEMENVNKYRKIFYLRELL